MDIYPQRQNLPHIPYFYIIQHISTGKKYAGYRKAINAPFSKNGCHPLELLQPNGYNTSSNTIKSIIAKEGLEAFMVVEIIEEPDMNGLSAYEYETKFLQENNIAGQPDYWFNKHNNNDETRFGNQEHYEAIMFERYGIVNMFQDSVVKEKIKLTNQKNHEVDYYVQTEEFKEKSKVTNRNKRNVDWPTQDPSVREKVIATNLEKYGVNNYSKTEEGRVLTTKMNLGSRWFNDGIKNYKVKAGKLPNESWSPGMMCKAV